MMNRTTIINAIKNIIYICFILFSNLLFANNLDDPNNPKNPFYQYEVALLDNDIDKATTVMNHIIINSKNNTELIRAYGGLAILETVTQKYEEANNNIKNAKDISEKTNSQLDKAYYLHYKARMYFRKKQYNEATKYLYESIKALEKNQNQYELLSNNYYYLTAINSRVRLFSKEYDKYVQLNLEYAIKSENPLQLIIAYAEQTLFFELNYRNKKKKEDSDKIFEFSNKMLELIKKHQNSSEYFSNRCLVMYYNNTASYINELPYKGLSQTERSKIAEENIKIAIAFSRNIKDLNDSLGACYLTYGEIMQSLNNDEMAEKHYLKAYEITKLINSPQKYIQKLIRSSLSNFYKEKKDYVNALKYKEEENKYIVLSYEQLIEDNQKYLEAQFNAEQQSNKIVQLQELNESYKKQKILLVGLITLFIAGLVFLIYLIRYKGKINKQKTELLEAEKQETELTLKLEQQEKARLKAEQELLALQQEQIQKNAMITSLKLEKKNSLLNEIKQTNDQKIKRLLKDDKLTDDDFDETQNVIQNVHPNFFNRLNEVSKSKLSNQDLKYAAFIYLNMDNTQIANILNVDPKTVRVTKYRLKQKIGLTKDDDLHDFILKLTL